MDENASLTDFMPDPQNANRGTERGVYMLEKSIERVGAGRSIVVSSDDVVLAGNKTQQAAIDAGITDAIVVETDGTRLVVVKRTDIKSGTPEAVDLAIADNRASEVGLDWDPAVLDALCNEGLVDDWFLDNELAELLAELSEEEVVDLDDGDGVGVDGDLIVCPKCGFAWSEGGD